MRIRLRGSALPRALVVLCSLGQAGAAAADVVPPDRRTVWNPGIPGGVPARTTVCATINASTYGDGAADAADGIQAALNACPAGQVVQLSAGEFKLTHRVEIRKGILLRGRGPAQTRLKMPVGTNDNLITVGTQWFKFTQPRNLASDAVKGASSVTLASAAGLQAGEIVAVDQLTDPAISRWNPMRSPPGDVSRTWFTRPDRPTGQVMEVASVSGNTVTFTTPFHLAFRTAFTAQLSRFSNVDGGPVVPAVKYAGVEDLYVYGGGNGNISFQNAAYSWVKNVESDYQKGEGVSLEASFRCVLRDSYVHSTQDPNPGGGGYGLSFSFYAADNLVENNVVWNMNKVMVMRASGGGNVIGYNYMEDGWISYATDWVEVGLNASHMTTPHLELFEGNASFNFDGDNTWGNAVYITAFRNHLTGKRRSAPPLQLTDGGNRRAAGLGEGHWWYTFVGNVLGTPGQSPAPYSSFQYQNVDRPWVDDPVPMWRLGYNPDDWDLPADPRVLGTLIRDGNYDYATGSVRWDNPAQAIPDSLYLTGKPPFFGYSPWPWVDAVGPVKFYTLPARARFEQRLGPTRFYRVTPCRVADTRNPAGPRGGPALLAGRTRDFPVAGTCGIPADAAAVAGNATVVNPAAAGFLAVFPPGLSSNTSTVNFAPGRTRANNLIVGLGATGAVTGAAVSAYCGLPSGQQHFVLDVVGYFK